MEEKVKFYKGQIARIEEDLTKEETFTDTQRYTNLMGIATNLSSLVDRLEGMIASNKALEESEANNK